MNTEFNIDTKDINDKLIEELKTITDEINNDPQKSITKSFSLLSPPKSYL